MKKIILIGMLAMMILLSAFFVSNSLESSIEAEVDHQRQKLVGLDINKNKYVDYETAFQDALSIGIDFTEITLSWDDIEISEGVYNDDILDVINIYYPSYDMKVALTFNIIDTVSLRVPDYLDGKSLSDKAVEEAFLKYLKHVLKKVDDVDLVAVAVGNEIDGYLKDDEWIDFESLFTESKDIIDDYFPGASVGTKLMFEGFENSRAEAILNISDVMMLTYYPVKDTLFVKSSSEIKEDLQTMVDHSEEKPLFMMEVGMPTSLKLSSSEVKQAEFIEIIFEYFKMYDHFEVVSVNWLNDRDELELIAFTEYYGLEDDKFYEYLSSLGLKDKNGNSKDGFDTFKVEVAKLAGEIDE